MGGNDSIASLILHFILRNSTKKEIMNSSILKLNKTIALESGIELVNPEIAYHTYGTLNNDKSNVVWVTHALTANSDVYDWWAGLVGPTDFINETEHFIVCANVLGSHYGTTSPLSKNPETGKSYYHTFPEFTIRDIVQLHIELANHLEIDDIHLLMGGSMGGHQALEWAIIEPERVKHLAVIAASAIHSPWGVAFNESQRWAIENDPTWNLNKDTAGIEGMKAARSLALLSYRNFKTYQKTQQPSSENLIFPDRASSYQKYQGEKLAKRFNAYSYYYLSKAMDSQNVGRNRGGIEAALAAVKAKTLVVSLEDDVLFPISDQLRLVTGIPNAVHQFIPSFYGHDGFLIETKNITRALNVFLNNKDASKRTSKVVPVKRNQATYSTEKIQIGLIGLGTVGLAVYDQLLERSDVEIRKAIVRRKGLDREIPQALISYDVAEVTESEDIKVIVEVIDDADAAYEYAKAVLKKGKVLISANKKMLARHLKELKELELIYGGKLLYEASVGGAIPVMRVIKEHYKSESIQRIEGIINGSTNYILTKMAEIGIPFSEALKDAQVKGFAESDPTLDVDGYDAAYKAVLLTYNAMGIHVAPEDVERVGISNISIDDIWAAKVQNQRIKLVATIEREGDTVSVSVKPRCLNPSDDLYHVNNELNAITIEGQYSGGNTLKGKGAGGHPTAAAVVADINHALDWLKQRDRSLVVS